MFKMTASSANNPNFRTYIDQEVDEDYVNLEELFAYFVHMTELMGYAAGSWTDIIKKLHSYNFDDTYDIYEWSTDIRVTTESK